VDHLASQGMVVDWAIHHRAGKDEAPDILPHVHMLITMRVFDPTQADVGRLRQNWLRTDKAVRPSLKNGGRILDSCRGVMRWRRRGSSYKTWSDSLRLSLLHYWTANTPAHGVRWRMAAI